VRQGTDGTAAAAYRVASRSEPTKDIPMNEDTIKGKWHQLSGSIKARWGKLTDDDMQRAEGNKEHLFGKLQEHYGLGKEKAAEQLKELGYI
jgi:uncharacterized protein YjbJ (UPF0337 family)